MPKSKQPSTHVDVGFYSLTEARLLTGNLSNSTLWRMECRGGFPARVKLSPGRSGYPRAAVNQWLREKEANARATATSEDTSDAEVA